MNAAQRRVEIRRLRREAARLGLSTARWESRWRLIKRIKDAEFYAQFAPSTRPQGLACRCALPGVGRHG